MPNHVYSAIEFKGSYDEVNEIAQLLEDLNPKNTGAKAFSFNKIIPQTCNPKDWYDWNINNWGTKWDAYEVLRLIQKPSNSEKFILENKAKVTCRILFQTAWSPVYPVIKKISEKFPNTKFEYAYEDEGGGFVGKDTYLGGEIIKQSESKSTYTRFMNKSIGYTPWNLGEKL